MRVAVGSDHAGFDLKEILKVELTAFGHDVADHGTHEAAVWVGYPDFGADVGRVVAGGEAQLGVCVCAALTRRHNHANVVCFGASTMGTAVALDALPAFLDAPEEHGRHDARIAKLAELVHQTTPEGNP